MAFIQEDGTGTIVGATTYAALTDFRSFATDRALTIPGADSACQVLLVKAMDYLERLDYKGFKFKQFQALRWPRYDVIIEGWPLLMNQIPQELIFAQCALANAYQTIELLPTGQPWDHGSVMADSIAGAVSESYANNARVIYVAEVEAAKRWLKQVVRNNGAYITRT